MTASERRLHPASLLFDAARYARIFAWPALLAFVSGTSGADPWMARYGYGGSASWLWILMVPSVGLSVARFLSFRIRYEPDALVIRSGILFRNIRHVPYARIQNLDAVQNVFHRLLGVVDVRIETGSGGETEARLSVLPRAALDEMRARVFAERAGRGAAGAGTPGAGAAAMGAAVDGPARDAVAGAPMPRAGAQRRDEPEGRDAGPGGTLLHLPLGELLLCGLLENKGMVLVGAAYGALWEAGIMNRVWSWFLPGDLDGRGLAREVAAALGGTQALPPGRILLALGGIAAFLVLVRLVSMAWAFLRLYDFRLSRRDDDLRVTFGLLTRVTATIPLRRVQSLTVRQTWLQRRLGRASIRVETAGGAPGASARDHEWVAPLVRTEAVAPLVAEILPGAGFSDRDWEPVHPRAFRRAVKPALLRAAVIVTVLLLALGWRAGWLAPLVAAWAVIGARQRVRNLRWAASDDAVAFRSGWLSRRETRVKANRIQVVTLRTSPFDRRAAMARVRVDTAGGGERSHRIDIPYLPAAVARALHGQLATRASRTAFCV